MVLRVDAGGCSARIAAACRDRNITYFMSARATAGIDAAIAAARCDPRRWSAAVANPAQRRSKAHVGELTDLVDLSGWPARTRLIVRREPRHPGAQRSPFDSDNFRLLGIPHRRHSQPCPARPRDEKARRRRGRRRASQGLRAGAHALHSLGRQLRMGSAVHHQRRARALVPDTLPHRASQTRGAQTAPLDAVAPARARVRDRPTRQAAAPHRTPRRQSPARRPAPQPSTPRPQPNITARTTRAAPPVSRVKNLRRFRVWWLGGRGLSVADGSPWLWLGGAGSCCRSSGRRGPGRQLETVCDVAPVEVLVFDGAEEALDDSVGPRARLRVRM